MTKGQRLYVVLSGLFIAFLFMAELTGGKLFQWDVSGLPLIGGLGVFTMTLGVIPFPVTFLITDLMNEYYGRRGVRFATLLAVVALGLAYVLILIDVNIPAWEKSVVTDEAFASVFLFSKKIILASIFAFLIGQIIDITVFHMLRKKTGNRHIWLRATGSTIVSQFFDSYLVIYLAFGTGESALPLGEVAQISNSNFTYKLLFAIGLTPLIYLGHFAIDRYLGKEGERLRELALRDESFAA